MPSLKNKKKAKRKKETNNKIKLAIIRVIADSRIDYLTPRHYKESKSIVSGTCLINKTSAPSENSVKM